MAASSVTPDGQDWCRYGGRVTTFVVLSCITAGMGGVIFGYDIGISGGVTSMDPFLRKFFPKVYRQMQGTNVSNYCKFNSQLLTAFTSSLYVAGLITTFLASWVTSRCGRRPSMIIAGAAFLAGGVIGGAAVDVYMIILGRVLLGVGLGFGNQIRQHRTRSDTATPLPLHAGDKAESPVIAKEEDDGEHLLIPAMGDSGATTACARPRRHCSGTTVLHMMWATRCKAFRARCSGGG